MLTLQVKQTAIGTNSVWSGIVYKLKGAESKMSVFAVF